VIEMEQAPPDERVHERAENTAEPLPPVWYQATVSPETEPVKPERVAVQVIEEPGVTEVAVQTLARLVLALIISWVVPELAVLLASPAYAA
jgi:hypothetical protein